MSEIEVTQYKLTSYQNDLNDHERYLSNFVKRHQLVIGALVPVVLYVAWKTNAHKHVLGALTKVGEVGLLATKLALK